MLGIVNRRQGALPRDIREAVDGSWTSSELVNERESAIIGIGPI